MPIQEWSDRIWVVKLGDEPALSEDLVGVRDKAQNAAAMPDLVLDLSGVTHFTSSNLSQLLRLRKLAISRDGKLRLAGPSNPVWAVLMVTGLEKVLDCTPDVPTALAGLQMGRA
jgi:anti-anti-sigma factor